jgi:SAM-dependent methyltransferase
MHQPVEYDAFADIYNVWAETAPAAERNLPFYVEEYLRTPGTVVELGVGNGRIAIEAARQGKPVIGVDYSAEMLTIPFHTIGHLVTLDDKRAGLRHIYGQLASGGRLIFDHFVFDPEAARRYQGVGLRNEYTDATTGHDVLLWMTVHYDFEAQTMRIITWADELDDDGVVIRRKYRRLSFSWLHPEQTRTLLEETGFEIEALYGDFDRCSFGDDSPEQVWVARRPAAT